MGGWVGGGTISGIWTLSAGARLNATYADLAERFEADAYYDAGTVVELGGEKEITSVRYELSEDIFGVISDTAAYLMNSGAGDNTTHPPVAMTGRVQVKVTGIVKKGDRLVSAGNGIARAAQVGEATAFNVIGRALANKTTNTIDEDIYNDEMEKKLLENRSMIDVVGMKNRLTLDQIKHLIKIFVVEQKATDAKHRDEGECAKHFIYWVKTNLDNVESQKQSFVKSNNKLLGL